MESSIAWGIYIELCDLLQGPETILVVTTSTTHIITFLISKTTNSNQIHANITINYKDSITASFNYPLQHQHHCLL